MSDRDDLVGNVGRYGGMAKNGERGFLLGESMVVFAMPRLWGGVYGGFYDVPPQDLACHRAKD